MTLKEMCKNGSIMTIFPQLLCILRLCTELYQLDIELSDNVIVKDVLDYLYISDNLKELNLYFSNVHL